MPITIKKHVNIYPMKITEEKIQLSIKESAEKERNKSDDSYAKILVQHIVYTLLALSFLGMGGFIWHLLTKSHL